MIRSIGVLTVFMACGPLCAAEKFEPLHAAVRVNGDNASCGTIFKVEPGKSTCTAYIVSTGHLAKRSEMKVEVFFLEGKELKEPLVGTGELLTIVDNHDKGVDFCVIKVELKCDAKKLCAAKLAKKVVFGEECTSVGCDGGIKPKSFSVTTTKWRTKDRDIFVKHSLGQTSTGGRSGGGIFKGNEVVAVYWGSYTGSEDLTDRGNGMATSVDVIRQILATGGFSDLLE